MRNFSNFLLNLNQRWLYLITFIIPFVVLMFNAKMPVHPEPVVTSLYKTVEQLGKDKSGKVVLVVGDFGPSTKAECYPQMECVVRHLFKVEVPFIAMTVIPEGQGFVKEMPKRIANEMGKKYGVDYVILGYKPASMVQKLSQAFPETAETDVNGTPIKDIPMLKDVKDVHQISMVVEMTGMVGGLETWLGLFMTQDYRPKFAHGCTAIAFPEANVYINSGQLVGLMNGMAGAAQYEYLLGRSGEASQGMVIHVFFHGYILILIILGNVAYFGSGAARKKQK